MHGTNVNTFCTHETNGSPMTDYMTYYEEHQAVRGLFEILKDINWNKVGGNRWSSCQYRRSPRKRWWSGYAR